MKVERINARGEKIDDLLNTLRCRTPAIGNEHANVKPKNGRRVIVSDGPGVIDVPVDDEVKRIIIHTHPYDEAALGPSQLDKNILLLFGKHSNAGKHQHSSYLLEHGILQKCYFNK